MSEIIPYISTEPPSLHEDSVETQSNASEKTADVIAFSGTENSIQNDKINNLSKTDSINDEMVVELHQYNNEIIESNNLHLDLTDSVIKEVRENDIISQCSFEGQFDQYIDNMNYDRTLNDAEMVEYEREIVELQTFENPFEIYQNSNTGIVNMEGDYDFGDFGVFNQPSETLENEIIEKNNELTLPGFANVYISQANIDVTDSACDDNPQELDDDFNDFATFEHESDNDIISQVVYLNTDSSIQTMGDIIESFHQKLLGSINTIDMAWSSLSHEDKRCNFISKDFPTTENGAQIWKELTNFDYSPAFIFQWMQSNSYENFMASIGPEYKELLSTQRATLPLYSVNLTPIEPVLVDNFYQNIHSTTSSSLDLSVHEKSGSINNNTEKNSNFDIKHLEDEFILNTSFSDDPKISNLKSDNRSSMPNLSSTVIQSEGFGGILKSMLKPLNPAKASALMKPLDPRTEAVLKDLPDLSYMTSKVLMFPVLASCDLEDNI